PRVIDRILRKTYIDSFLEQFFDAGESAALGIGILAALQIGIFCGAGNKIDPTGLEQAHHPKSIGIVRTAKRTGVTGCRFWSNSFDHDQCVEQLQETGHNVIRLVAVNIDHLVVLQGQFHDPVDRPLPYLSSPFEMRNSAYAIRSHLQSLFHQLMSSLVGIHAFLGKGYNLYLYFISEFFTKLQHGTYSLKLRVSHVYVGADKLYPMRHFFSDSGQGTLLYIFYRLVFFNLVPAGYAFEK